MSRQITIVGASVILAALVHGCGGSTPAAGSERGACLQGGACNAGLVCLSDFCVRPAGLADGGAAQASPLVVSTATRTPRTTATGVNYWLWMPAFGDDVTATDTLTAALKPTLMRVGGYNNDANTQDPFDDAAFDTAVAYARAIGAEPIIQVPLLADTSGKPPTAATAAAMVTYANVTKSYGLKYFSIGNEPDLYASQGLVADPTQPAIPGYSPGAYCATARDYVTAMKAVDPTIKIVGPDLSWKYIAGSSATDWLTPILTSCGDLFDIVAIHRYPFEAAQATLAAAAADAASFRNVMTSVRGILQATGQGAKPLALTEMNVVYDATFCVLDASPGTVGAALWLADGLGTANELGLWTSAVWDISDDDGYALGLLGPAPGHTPRPAYYAYALFADYFGPTLVEVTSAPSGVNAYASRNQADDATEIMLVNWNRSAAPLAFSVAGLTTAPSPVTFVLPPVSIAAVVIPDHGAATAWTYGDAQRETASGPQSLPAGMTGPPVVTDGGSQGGAGAAGKTPGASCATDGAVVCPADRPVEPHDHDHGRFRDGGRDLRFGRHRVAVVHLRGARAGASHRGVGPRWRRDSDCWRFQPSGLRKLGGRGAVPQRRELHRRVDVHRRPVRLRRRSGWLRARLRRLVQRRHEHHRRSGTGLLPRHRLHVLRAARASHPRRRDDHDDQGPLLGADRRLSYRQARSCDHRRRGMAAERADRRRRRLLLRQLHHREREVLLDRDDPAPFDCSAGRAGRCTLFPRNARRPVQKELELWPPLAHQCGRSGGIAGRGVRARRKFGAG